MTDETGMLATGIHIAATLGLPLLVNGQPVAIPAGLIPELPGPTDEQLAAYAEIRERGARPDIEDARRAAFCMRMAGCLLNPLVDALTDCTAAAANSNTRDALATIEVPPPTGKMEPMARATESFADAADVKSFGANAWLLDDILIERIEGRFAIRPRFGDAASAEHATTEGEALTQARRMAAAHTDGDTR